MSYTHTIKTTSPVRLLPQFDIRMCHKTIDCASCNTLAIHIKSQKTAAICVKHLVNEHVRYDYDPLNSFRNLNPLPPPLSLKVSNTPGSYRDDEM